MELHDKKFLTTSSRTHNSVRNAVVGLIFFVVMMLLQFISRRVFIHYLGVEVLGINATIVSLLEFLNIAELGISTAVGYTLYKPIAEGDADAIGGILGLHRRLYGRVAVALIIGGGILMIFFPDIFAKSGLPLWYAYSTFIVMLTGALAGYLFNYSQVLLTAAQQDFKVNIAYRAPKTVIILLQIIGIVYFTEIGYQLWLVFEVIGIVTTTLLLRRIVRDTCPGLRVSDRPAGELKGMYPEVMKTTGLLMYHKIGGFLVKQMTPFMVYLFVSVSTVAVYANYLLIMTGLFRLIEALFKGIEAGIGNMTATEERGRELHLFSEMLSLRIFLGTILFFAFYTCANPFTTIWIGTEYEFGRTSIILLGALLYTWTIKGCSESFALAKGVVGDIWAPIAEGGITLLISAVGGYYFGLNGVLTGALTGVALLTFFWKPYYLFTRGFETSWGDLIKLYFRPLILSMAAGLGIAIGLYYLVSVGSSLDRYLTLGSRDAWHLFISGVTVTIIFAILFYGVQYICNRGTRMLTSRIYQYLKRKR